MRTCSSVVESRLCILWSLVRFPVGRLRYTLLMRANNVEIAVQWFRMSCAVFAGLSGHYNPICNIIPVLGKMYISFPWLWGFDYANAYFQSSWENVAQEVAVSSVDFPKNTKFNNFKGAQGPGLFGREGRRRRDFVVLGALASLYYDQSHYNLFPFISDA